MLSATITCMNRSFEYDSANRLVKADAYRYIYDGEDVRIKSVYYTTETEYVYNTNAKLGQLLQRSVNGVVTKYVYGLGLIGEEKFGTFKTYHFDYRGSTSAITDIYGNITDTFSYDTYGNLLSRSGHYTDTPFMYNGRDGVMTDNNGLIYMRARYYCPELRRFINADILHGEISDSTSLNRYSYVNGNPVSFVDPFGLEAKLDKYINSNYSGIKNVSLVINSPNINSRDVAKIENGELNNGHSFIRLDDGNGKVRYVGFVAKSYNYIDMLLGKNVEGEFADDSESDWNVAKVYTLSDKQYSYISDYIESLDSYKWNYNIETYNCTTFAVNTVRLQGAAAGNFMTVREHDWTLPKDIVEQLKNHKSVPNEFTASLFASILVLAMDGFYGYTPADAAQDLINAEGTVLLKSGGVIKTITNTTYIRAK